MGKIAQADAKIMNSLYASELNKGGVKVAGSEDPQAFEDHKEMMAKLKDVLSSDDGQAWDPNDPLLD